MTTRCCTEPPSANFSHRHPPACASKVRLAALPERVCCEFHHFAGSSSAAYTRLGDSPIWVFSSTENPAGVDSTTVARVLPTTWKQTAAKISCFSISFSGGQPYVDSSGRRVPGPISTIPVIAAVSIARAPSCSRAERRLWSNTGARVGVWQRRTAGASRVEMPGKRRCEPLVHRGIEMRGSGPADRWCIAVSKSVTRVGPRILFVEQWPPLCAGSFRYKETGQCWSRRDGRNVEKIHGFVHGT